MSGVRVPHRPLPEWNWLPASFALAVRGLSGASSAMRAGIVVFSFLPFVYYAARDTAFHFRGRQVSLAEHLLHLAVGLSLAFVLTSAILGKSEAMLVGLVLFAVAGAMDE